MKKINKKVKKILISLFMAIISFPKKIFAVYPSEVYSENPGQTMYGIVTPADMIGKFSKKIILPLIVPIIMIIGLIVYFKKKKTEWQDIVIISIISLVVAVLWFFIMKYYIVPLF